MAPSSLIQKPLVVSESTVLQKQTEKECQPYLEDLTKLPDDQKAHLERIGLFKEDRDNDNTSDWVQLLRGKHRKYLEGVWKRPLKAPFVSLDSSRPWMLYWCLHGYDLLSLEDENSWITDAEGANMVSTLEDCWEGYHTPHSQVPEIVASDDSFYFLNHEDDGSESYYCGGFGGGPGQMAHAATTYAAVLALCILATSSHTATTTTTTVDASTDYESLHYSQRARRMLSEIRIPLYRWMVSLQVPDTGGYRMQHDGEVDVRATYTIACCSKLLGLLQPRGNATTKAGEHTVLGRPLVVDFVKSCQTYEGGMGGEPFSEAHGGYTFCAVAALKLLGALDSSGSFDVGALLGWLGRRQLSYEGGFSGRANKLVDGCYSFWQGGAVAIASSSCSSQNPPTDDDPWLARHRKQQQQEQQQMDTNPSLDPSTNLPFPLLYNVFLLERYILLCAQEITGGLRDKPSKPRDFYHTCYNLSGLSIAQHCSFSNDDENSVTDIGFGDPQQTQVGQTHPCYNIRTDRVATILGIDWENE